jgi:formylglycine-generating enzyme
MCSSHVLRKAFFLSLIFVVAVFAFAAAAGKQGNQNQPLVEMVWIEPGTFMMGASADLDDNALYIEFRHEVTLTKGFYMGKYPITQGQYQAVMGSNSSYFKNKPAAGEAQAKRPVESVSWYAALVFCNKLSVSEGLQPVYVISESTDPNDWGNIPSGKDNARWNKVTMAADANGYRLPTEAEWEYACRAGSKTPYSTGGSMSNNTGWYKANSDSKTHEVGLKKPANAWGLYDMHGNVWEWVWDRYDSDYYTADGAGTDPTGPASGSYRIFRGGSWSDDAWGLRAAYRNRTNPWDRLISLGFRVARNQ